MRARMLSSLPLLLLLASLLSGTTPLFADSRPPFDPTLQEFREFCARHRAEAANISIARPPLNKPVFVPVAALEATQTRFSFDRLLKSLRKVVRSEDLEESQKSKSGYKFFYGKADAVYPLSRKTTGIFYRGKLYIIDGHHRALISSYFGADSIPMEVIADWSDKSPQKFFFDLESQGYSYYKNHRGARMNPVDLCDLQDDPFLLLAREIMLRVDLEFEGDHISILNVRGAKKPIAIKLNRDIPFCEFEIADRLRRGRFKWKPGDKIPRKKLAKFLKRLRMRRDSEHFAQVLLLDQPTSVEDLELLKIIEEHFQHHQCEHQLMSGDND